MRKSLLTATSFILSLPGFVSTATNSLSTDVLATGTPESVGMLSAPLQDLQKTIGGYTTPANYGSASYNQVHPLYPGAAVLIGHNNTIVSHFATGYARKYADANGTVLPQDQWVPMQKDAVFDLASLTKLWTTIAALQFLERRRILLNATVATYVPQFATNGKQNVTILMLLTHTSGFDADPVPGLWYGYSNLEDRRTAVITQKLLNTPGAKYLYSDLNFMTLQIVLETLSGLPLDDIMKINIFEPMGLASTSFNRGNNADFFADKLVAPTEYQIQVLGDVEPQRPQPVWRMVHDENAWGTDGASGHAGLFSSAGDLAAFCQMILNNGQYNSRQILQPATVDLIFQNFNTNFPGNEHGLGFELNQSYWSGAMRSLQTAGHTGYTGTSLAIDRRTNTFFILLTNRVHPNRNWSNINIARQAVGNAVASSLAL